MIIRSAVPCTVVRVPLAFIVVLGMGCFVVVHPNTSSSVRVRYFISFSFRI